LLSQRLADLSEEFRQRDLVSEPNKAIMERMQRDKEHLASKLADVEGKRANWDLIKTEFGGAWNSFVADLEMLKIQLMDAVSAARERKTVRGSEAPARNFQA
jgi:hypothetical protein